MHHIERLLAGSTSVRFAAMSAGGAAVLASRLIRHDLRALGASVGRIRLLDAFKGDQFFGGQVAFLHPGNLQPSVHAV